MRLAGIAMRLQVAPASLVSASPRPVQPDTNPTRESTRWMAASETVFVVAIALGCVVTDGPMLGEGR
jgi:hypothetical protein